MDHSILAFITELKDELRKQMNSTDHVAFYQRIAPRCRTWESDLEDLQETKEKYKTLALHVESMNRILKEST